MTPPSSQTATRPACTREAGAARWLAGRRRSTCRQPAPALPPARGAGGAAGVVSGAAGAAARARLRIRQIAPGPVDQASRPVAVRSSTPRPARVAPDRSAKRMRRAAIGGDAQHGPGPAAPRRRARGRRSGREGRRTPRAACPALSAKVRPEEPSAEEVELDPGRGPAESWSISRRVPSSAVPQIPRTTPSSPRTTNCLAATSSATVPGSPYREETDHQCDSQPEQHREPDQERQC